MSRQQQQNVPLPSSIRNLREILPLHLHPICYPYMHRSITCKYPATCKYSVRIDCVFNAVFVTRVNVSIFTISECSSNDGRLLFEITLQCSALSSVTTFVYDTATAVLPLVLARLPLAHLRLEMQNDAAAPPINRSEVSAIRSAAASQSDYFSTDLTDSRPRRVRNLVFLCISQIGEFAWLVGGVLRK